MQAVQFMTSLSPIPMAQANSLSVPRIIEVRTARLDTILARDLNITAVKIDVEEAECHVLEGMQGILQRCHPDLVIEITPEYLQGLGRTVADIDRFYSRLDAGPSH